MRGTLVLYLFVASALTPLYMYYFDVLTMQSVIRGLAFAPITIFSVWLGAKLFNARWEPYYRPFCLGLLMFLATIGLIRLAYL